MSKIAFITGSSRGIGKQIGIDLLNKNYFVYFNGRNKEIILDSSNSDFIQADLSDSNNILDIVLKLSNLDVLVLNAGITDRTPFGDVQITNWNKVFEMNVTVPFFLVQALKDKINPNGKIIFISSISGIIPDSVSIAYGVSKAAINMMVLYLAKEFADKKITVNAIAPGYIMTDWHKDKPKEQLERIATKCLVNRFGTPEEISKAVQFIVDNDFINGQIIRIDGGWKNGC